MNRAALLPAIACFYLLCLIVNEVCAADNFLEQLFDFEFVYHHQQNLLLTVHGSDCYYIDVSSIEEQQLTDPVGKLQLELEVVKKIQSHDGAIRASTLGTMRDQYADRLADFHCLDKRVYTLQLDVQTTSVTPSTTTTSVPSPTDGVRDCHDILQMHPHSRSGVFDLNIHGHDFPAYCDHTTDGGGWTVFLNRFDGSTDFNLGWQSYVDGFGDQRKEYWLGLNYIHGLTSQRHYQLRVDMEDRSGNHGYAIYNTFQISDDRDAYRLHVSDYHGNVGDSLINADNDRHPANGMQFSTRDRDHDISPFQNCAESHRGGWWHRGCYEACPTCTYGDRGGMIWDSWHRDQRTMLMISMKMRSVPQHNVQVLG